jgi:hypothetical protein
VTKSKAIAIIAVMWVAAAFIATAGKQYVVASDDLPATFSERFDAFKHYGLKYETAGAFEVKP